MKYLLIVICVLILLENNVFAKPLEIGISAHYKGIGNFDFYVEEVRDEREKRDSIGYFINSWGYEQNIRVSDTCEKVIQKFLHQYIPDDSNKQHVNLVIKEFGVSEIVTEPIYTKISGSGHLICEYYTVDGKLLYMTDNTLRFVRSNTAKDFYPDFVAFLFEQSIKTFTMYDRKSNIYHNLLGIYNLCDSILKVDTYRKGFYANFREFQANNPSFPAEFEIVKDSCSQSVNCSRKNIGNLLPFIWGFSDGQTIYKKSMIVPDRYDFVPIRNLGRYTYVGSRYERQAVPILLPFFVGVIALPYEQDYIMDLNSGKEYPLEDKTLRIILGLDPLALDAYLKQPYERREVMGLYWVRQYNMRYKERISIEK